MSPGEAGSRLDVTVNVGSPGALPTLAHPDLLETAVLHVLRQQGIEAAEISLTLLGDDGIREMNRRYLSRDRPTDVIAFSLGDDEAVLGDVYVGLEEAVRQAGSLDVPLEEELVRLAVHGTLHVLGHDHPEGEGREESPMYRLQEQLVGEVLSGR